MEPGQRLTGKVAIVSGGASGIGAETARTFGTHGASVVVSDVNATAGEAVAAAIESDGGRAIYRSLDVTDETGWKTLVSETEAMFGKIIILTNIGTKKWLRFGPNF